MTELECELEHYMNPGTFYDGKLILQVPGRVEQEIKKYKWKEPKMTNAEYIQKNGWKFGEMYYEISDGCLCIYKGWKLIGKAFNVSWKPEYAFITWLDEEYKESVLDETEKEYLSAVIKPFKDRVIKIVKVRDTSWRENIEIHVKQGNDFHIVNLPKFGEGEMYKGMEAFHSYSLEELGL